MSPTAVIEGRTQDYLEERTDSVNMMDVRKEALLNNIKARHANTDSPYVQEKQQVLLEFSDDKNPTTFNEAWSRIDQIEQRESE